jgi:hypothetical protein
VSGVQQDAFSYANFYSFSLDTTWSILKKLSSFIGVQMHVLGNAEPTENVAVLY